MENFMALYRFNFGLRTKFEIPGHEMHFPAAHEMRANSDGGLGLLPHAQPLIREAQQEHRYASGRSMSPAASTTEIGSNVSPERLFGPNRELRVTERFYFRRAFRAA
ncbi:MAG TPA: hypothetical protein VGL35_02610 [Rhizomicrobium sp.]|jgi:hypothetical protein